MHSVIAENLHFHKKEGQMKIQSIQQNNTFKHSVPSHSSYAGMVFRANNNNYTNEPWKRVRTMAIGMSVGGLGALAYYSHKNYTGKRLWLHSLETGAAIGLCADILNLIADIPNNKNVHKSN